MSKQENYDKRAPLVACLCLLLLLAIACIAAANAHARPHGITVPGSYVCFDKHHHEVACPPKHHHHERHHKKHQPKHHRHTSESKCVIVINGEKTVTHGSCPPVKVESSSTTTTTTPASTPVEGEHSCEHNPLPGECVIHCTMSVEVSPGECTGPVIVNPIAICEEVNTPNGPIPSCRPEEPEKSPCAEKICVPLPEEECSEEKGEVAGPKG